MKISEVVLIKNPDIRNFAEKAIEALPDYFFTVPASSTGKYHPAYALGEGGLLRHVRAAVRIAYELFRIDSFKFTDDEKDLILVALLLHDGWKHGEEEKYSNYAISKHPLVASKKIKELFLDKGLLENEQIEFICEAIETHMGQWVKSWTSENIILQAPKTEAQKFVHLADYLASRKCIEINFEAELSKN